MEFVGSLKIIIIMKTLILKFLGVIIVVVFAGYNVYSSHLTDSRRNLELINITLLAYAENGSTDTETDGYSCSVTSTCFGLGGEAGSVSCTGTTKCERGSGGLFSNPWVKCDGRKTSC